MEEKTNEKDNILTRISFDFNKPVNATIYYEDSDEETSQPDVKQEITDKDHRNEDRYQIKDTKQPSNDLNINSAFESSNIKANTEKESLNEKELIKTLKEFVSNIQTNNEVNSNCLKKRKQNSSPPKPTKICKQDTKNNHPEMRNINNPQTIVDNFYVMNLLNSVSKHLITIYQAFDYHNQIQNNKLVLQNTIDNSMTYFLRLKYHYFNLSLCTVATVILPQVDNKDFIRTFLNDTIKIAYDMKTSISYQKIIPIFKDLITWTKQKQKMQIPLQFDVTKAQQFCENKDSLLKAHLNCKQRPLSKAYTSAENFNINNYLYSAQMSAEQIQPSNNTDYLSTARPTVVQHPPSNLAFRPSGDYLPNPNSEQSNSSNFTYKPTINHSSNSIVTAPQLPPSNLVSRPTIQKHNTNARMSAVQVLPDNITSNPRNNHFTDTTITAAQMQHPNFTSIPQKRKDYLDPSESTGPGKSCLYSAGPPWRRMSINVDNALLDNHNKQVGSSLNNTINLPAQDQDYSNAFRIYMKQFPQPQSSVEPKRSAFPQQMPTNYQNYSISQSLPNQLPIPTPQTNNKQMVQQIEIELFEQNQIETTRSLSTDSGFMSPLHFNTAADPTCTSNDGTNRETMSCSGRGQFKAAAESKHPLPQMATLQIAIGQEENKTFQVPQITHVTSLNPSAAYITEGKCYVCEKVTKKKCIGCLKFYYCSYECQRADWCVHMGLCGNT